MADNKNQLDDESLNPDAAKLDAFREKLRNIDMTPVEKAHQALMQEEDLSDEQREELINQVEKAFHESGKVLVERAIELGIFTQEEYNSWLGKYQIKYTEISAVLQAHFANEEETPVVLTKEGSSVWKMRKIFQERLDIEIVTLEKLHEMMKK